jgi:hypothetical protein
MSVPQFDTWSIHGVLVGVLVAGISDIASLTKPGVACALVAIACIATLIRGVYEATPLNALQPMRIVITAKAPAT